MSTAVLYARYSTDLQNEKSVEDQFALCERYAARENLRISDRFSDRAKSGATLFDRDGLQDLLIAAKAKKFSAVIVESLDRLSRDQADLALIFKRLNFLEIKLLTVNEGLTTNIHIGVRGLLGSIFLKDLSDKVRRGFDGRVREGKIPGARTYGYRTVLGKPGEREIDQAQAEVVRRIFQEYAAGASPRAIATGLSRDGIPTFSGAKAWNHQTFIAGRYGTGMISNELYIGRIVWNRAHRVKNPETGKTIKRMAPAEDLIVTEAAHLRIIDQDLWDAAQAVRLRRSESKFGPGGKLKRRPHLPMLDHLLADMLVCGACGGHMRITNVQPDGSRRVGCAAAHMHGTCQHRKSYDLTTLRNGVVARGREYLTDPEYVREAMRAFCDQFAEEYKRTDKERTRVRKELTNIAVKIHRIIDAIENGTDAVKVLVGKLNDLERDRVNREKQLALLDAQTKVIELPPKNLDAFVGTMKTLFDTLIAAEADADPEIRDAFRNVIRTIEVIPTGRGVPYAFKVYMRAGAVTGMEMQLQARTPKEILAEQGVSCDDSDYAPVKPSTAGLTEAKSDNGLIYLGIWRQAAQIPLPSCAPDSFT